MLRWFPISNLLLHTYHEPSELKFVKLKPLYYKEHTIIFPLYVIYRYFRKSKLCSLCLKPLLLTILSIFTSDCPYQKERRVKPWKLLAKCYSSPPPKVNCFSLLFDFPFPHSLLLLFFYLCPSFRHQSVHYPFRREETISNWMALQCATFTESLPLFKSRCK
jgi:hypothetical protein